MFFKNKIFLLFIGFYFCLQAMVSCQNNNLPPTPTTPVSKLDSATPIILPVKIGAARTEAYFPLLQGKKVGLIVNQTSTIGETHLVDSLLAAGIEINVIFAPEHGFRGTADAGETIKNGVDTRTGLPIISLYGNQKKPTPEMLKGLEILVFDIQDVGARFYTYISTMHYVMEACAENNLPFVVLDRPNPNGHYVDGAVLNPSQKSFVGIHPIPIVHGLTVAELARMINGEKWLQGGLTCDLTYIPCENYDHQTRYELPIKPSPNLPNMRAIYLYPSLCLFEGTTVSMGRGTPTPFQIYGHPNFKKGNFEFIPKPTEGAKNPPHEGKKCYGFDLTSLPLDSLQRIDQIQLDFLVNFYQKMPSKKAFFNDFFNKLAGNSTLQQQLKKGISIEKIRQSWANDLAAYKIKRKQYLLYTDFE